MKKGVIIFWIGLILLVCLRVGASFYRTPHDASSCQKQIVSGSGIVYGDPEIKESGQVILVETDKFRVASSSMACPSGLLIRLKTKSYPRFVPGDHVSFTGKLLQPSNFESGNGRMFDYSNYLAKDGIFYEMKSAQVRLLMNDAKDTGGAQEFLVSSLYLVKRKFVTSLNRSLGEPHAALAAGLVVGEKAALGKDLLDDFRTVGLIHIVVLSGYNITIVAEALRRAFSRLPRVWGILAGAVGIILFGILVGGGATVVRSCAMASIALFADLIRRDYNVVRSLFLAALLMVIQNPMILLHDPSFQLSFLATLGLLILAAPIEKRLALIPERFGLRGIVASTIATQVFVSPFILHMVGQTSLVGMIANILVLPFVPLTMLLVFLTGISGMIWFPAAQAFGWLSHFLLSYELLIVENFAVIPFASISIPPFSFLWVVAFYTIFAVTFFGLRIWRERFCAS